MLASYLHTSACDQLEFISHVQTGVFSVEQQAINLSQPPLRPAGGEFDTTKADLERSRLSNIWFISTVCDPHVNRGVFEDNRSHLLQSVKVPLRAEHRFTSRQNLVAVQKNPYMHIYLKADISVVFSLVLEKLIWKHFDKSNKGGIVQKMMVVCALMNVLKGDKENMQSV